MSKQMTEEEQCEAVVWPNVGACQPHRCDNRSKHDAEGYRLCGTHHRTYLRGTRMGIYGGPRDDRRGCKMKTYIKYMPPDADQVRYKVEAQRYGAPCIRSYKSDWREEWDDANPDKAMVLRELSVALLEYADRLERNALKAREASTQAIIEADIQ